MINKKIKAIIFDADGVLFKAHDKSGNYLWSRRIKEDLGMTSKHFSLIFSDKWESIIRGKIKLDDHLHAIFQEKSFKELGITPEQYIQYWLTHDHHVNQGMLDFVKSLKIPSYIGTNQEAVRTRHILDTFGCCFTGCFASYQMGFIKPEPGFFQHIQRALDHPGYELLLIDDMKPYIDGAQDCGWHVYHYQNDIDGLMDFLKQFDAFDYLNV